MDYEKIYDNLVSYRRENVLNESNCEYYETHHIVPRSIDKKLIYKKTNKVNLTVREHFVAHLLLKRIYKKKFGEDSYQYRAMVKTCFLFANKHKDVTINSRTIEKLRIAYKKLPSPMKGRPMSDNAKKALHKANIGRKHTKEHRQKILESRIKNGNNKLSEEHKQILIESRLGSKHTEETKEKISSSNKGKHYHTLEFIEMIRKLNSRSYEEQYGEQAAYQRWIRSEHNKKPRYNTRGDNNPSKKPEVREKISKALKGRVAPNKGYRCVNNGVIQKQIPPDAELPEGFVFGRLKRST